MQSVCLPPEERVGSGGFENSAEVRPTLPNWANDSYSLHCRLPTPLLILVAVLALLVQIVIGALTKPLLGTAGDTTLAGPFPPDVTAVALPCCVATSRPDVCNRIESHISFLREEVMQRLVRWMLAAIAVMVLAPSAFAQFFSINPSMLEFGNLAIGSTKTLEAYLVYNGQQQAILNHGWNTNTNNDQYTVTVSVRDSSLISPGDTVRITVDFHPAQYGFFRSQYRFSMLGVVASLDLVGSTDIQTGLSMKQSACIGVEVGTSAQCAMTFTNSNATEMTLAFTGVDAPFLFSVDGGVTVVNGITLAAGASQDVVFTFSPTAVGVVRDEFTIVNGAQTITAFLEGTGVATVGQNPISTNPDIMFMYTDDATQTDTKSVTVTNNGQQAFVLSRIFATTDDPSVFTITIGNPVPVMLAQGESYTVSVTFTPDGTQEDYSARLYFSSDSNGLFVQSAYTTLVGRVGPVPGDTIRVGLVNTGGPIGGTADVVFTNQSNIPSDVAYAHATLRYNASVLVPQGTLINDGIENGMRTTTVRIDPLSHAQGQTLASVKFTITLGDADKTPVELVAMEWYDVQGAQLNTQTIANGAVVSVDDAEGRTVNANGDIMTMSVSPMPVSDNAVVAFERLPGNARLTLFATTGTEVMDFSSILQGAQEKGSVQVNFTSVPIGTYYLRLSVGTSTVVRRIVVN